MPGLRTQSTTIARAAYLGKAEAALLPLETVPKLADLRAALRGRDPRRLLVEVAVADDVPRSQLQASLTWLGCPVAAADKEGTVASSLQLGEAEFELRFWPLSRPVAIDLEEPAAGAAVVVLGGLPDNVLRERLAAYAAGVAGARLLVITPVQLEAGLEAMLGAQTELTVLAGSEALEMTSLSEALGGAAEIEALYSEAQVLSARRLLTAAFCLVNGQQRRQEGELLIAREANASSPSAGFGEDPFTQLSDELAECRRTIAAFVTNLFGSAATRCELPPLAVEAVAERNSQGGRQETVFEFPAPWLHEARQRAVRAVEPAFDNSRHFLEQRVADFEGRVRAVLVEVGVPRPSAVPTLAATELARQAKIKAEEVQVPSQTVPARSFMGAVSRNNPLAIVTSLLPLFAIVSLLWPETAGTSAGAWRRSISVVVMGMGSIFVLYSLVTAPARLRRDRATDRAEARTRLETLGREAVAEAVIDAGTLTLAGFDRHLEMVKAWLAAGARPAARGARAAPDPQQGAETLRAQHRELGNRARTLAELLGARL